MRFSRVVLALLTLASRPVAAQDHLVAPAQAQDRLAAAEAARQGDLARLDRTLATADAARVAGRVGIDVRAVRRSLPLLSDAEAHDLATRAAALDSDPAAGVLGELTDLVILVLLVLLVILVARKV